MLYLTIHSFISLIIYFSRLKFVDNVIAAVNVMKETAGLYLITMAKLFAMRPVIAEFVTMS